jgi:hypothetical protein
MSPRNWDSPTPFPASEYAPPPNQPKGGGQGAHSPQRVQMKVVKGILPWLVRWAHRVGTRDFYPALAALVSPVHKYSFSHRTIFQFMCPHRPATWAGSRAGPPIFECVSPVALNIHL